MVTRQLFGINELPARAAFEERALYKEYAMAQYDELNLTDFLYRNPYYGRIDTEGFVISPKEEFLAQFSSTEPVLSLDVIVEVYEKFINSFVLELYSRYGIQNFNSHFVNFTPQIAWTSIEPIYFSYQEGLFNAFMARMDEDIPLRVS